MTILKRILLGAFVILFSGSKIFSQKLANTLLWRISGKGLKQPSYLYGTMHLNDSRLFDLGDSLYNAIEHTQGFAIEVNPEDLTGFLIDEIKKQILDSKSLKELLSEEDYNKYAPVLSKKLNKPKDDITSADIIKEKNKWIAERYKTGKMQTFLDAYLYDLARRQGKWTGGIEDIDDQRGLLDDLVDKTDIQQIATPEKKGPDPFLEKFIEVYTKGDLSAIDSITNLSDGAQRDKILIKRNIKMAMRMDSLSSVRTMVFAVGVAHLPGPEGVIELLRKKGFTVEPVFAGKKIAADNYKIKEVPLVWEKISDEKGMYEIDMPGKPGDMRLYNIINMKIYIDIFNSTGYFITAVRYITDESNMDSTMDAVADKTFNGKSKWVSVPITIDGAIGKSYISDTEDMYQKEDILRKDNVMYMAMATAMKGNEESLKSVDKFFSSFKIKNSKPDSPGTSFVFTDSVLAYTVELPEKPEIFKEATADKKKDGIRSVVYSDVDNQQGAYLFFGVNTVLPGMYIDNDSVSLESLKTTIKKKTDSVITDSLYFKNNYRVLQYSGYVKQGGLTMDTRYFMRGNRWYAIVAMYNALKPHTHADRFLQSFSMLDYPSATWRKITSSDKFCSTWSPGEMASAERDSTDDPSIDIKYNSFDSTRSDSYAIIGFHFDPNFWSTSDSAFWADRISARINYSDSLISKKPIVNGDARGWEFVRLRHGSSMYQRFRLLLFGNRVYSIFASKPKPDVYDKNTNRFFEDFRFNKAMPATTLFESKARVLLNNLFSKDSATAVAAIQYLDRAPFGKKDLPCLHEALVRTGITGNEELSVTSAYYRIKSHIISINDSSSFYFASGHYATMADSSYDIKNALLDIMCSFPSTARFDTMITLLTASPPHAALSYKFIRALKDTAALAVLFAPRLLPLLKDSFVQASLINVCASLVDSNLLGIKSLLPYETSIVQCAMRRIKKLHTDADDYNLNDESIVELLGLLKTPAGNAALRKWLTVKNNFQKIRAVMALLKNKQSVDINLYTSIAADKASRLTLYRALKEIHKESLFPLAYKTQKMFGQSAVYDIAAEDEDPSSVIFLSGEIINFKGKRSRFYFYKVAYPSEDAGSTYLGCAGPYDIEAHLAGNADVHAGIYSNEEFDAKKLNEQKKMLIKQMEDVDWK